MDNPEEPLISVSGGGGFVCRAYPVSLTPGGRCFLRLYRNAIHPDSGVRLENFHRRYNKIRVKFDNLRIEARNTISSFETIGLSPQIVAVIALAPQILSVIFYHNHNDCQFMWFIGSMLISCVILIMICGMMICSRLIFLSFDVSHYWKKLLMVEEDMISFGGDSDTGLLGPAWTVQLGVKSQQEGVEILADVRISGDSNLVWDRRQKKLYRLQDKVNRTIWEIGYSIFNTGHFLFSSSFFKLQQLSVLCFLHSISYVEVKNHICISVIPEISYLQYIGWVGGNATLNEVNTALNEDKR